MLFGNFMAILDISIVSSSLLNIQAGLSASAEQMVWVQSAYLIAEVVAIPLSGFLSRLLSTRGMFLLSAGGFTIMSLASAFAWNIESMIVFRVLQGFFGGGMIPTTMASVFLIFPREKTMQAQIMVGLVSTLGPVIGPTLGGYLTDMYSWHWLFLINVFPGILICMGVSKFVHIDKPDFSLLAKMDYLSLTAMAVFLGALEYILEEGPRNSWFEDSTILACALASVAGGVVFFWRSLTRDNPVVDLAPFRNKNFALASLFTFFLGVSLYGANFVLPLFLGQVRGYSSLQIGELMAVAGATMFLSAPLIGNLVKVVPKKYISAGGTLLLALSCYLNAQLTADWGFHEMFLTQVLRGVGLICCFIPLTDLAMGTLPPDMVKSASGLFNLMRNLGGAFGLAYLNTQLESLQAFHWQQLIPAINLGRTEVVDTLTTTSMQLGAMGVGVPEAAALASIGQRLKLEALVLTYNDLFLIIAALAIGALVLVPFIKETKTTNSVGGH